jgi:uncharacterized protein YggE
MEAEKMSLKSIFMALMAIALCAAGAMAQDSSLRVTGVGSVLTDADTTIIAVSAQNSSDNVTIAQQANSQVLAAAEKSLIAAGVKEEEIMKDRTKGYSAYHRVICNTVNNTTSCRDVITNIATEQMVIKLKTTDRERINKTLAAAESSGADASVIGYALNDSSQAYEQARKRALENAKAKAEDYASALGYRLGEAVYIEDAAYPDIEMGPSYGWRYPWGMHHMWRGLGSRMMWIDSFPMMDGFLSDDLNEDYIPAGKARVTAYVRVEYKVAAA